MARIDSWPPYIKSLGERGYRKHMAKRTKVEHNGKSFILQQVSPKWYMRNLDRFGRGKSTERYTDEIYKNVVVEPIEVRNQGLDYFDENNDLETASWLLEECENFLANSNSYDDYTGKEASTGKQ